MTAFLIRGRDGLFMDLIYRTGKVVVDKNDVSEWVISKNIDLFLEDQS